ncbi:hypothetical protein KSD_91070 [Ktedonobacter sp. SOSP1-85]|uniref:hypothetical protein n=1 Tax=Ktedonobacter sp. SOSP1-85 TaxID=2778367 RepID=UPI001915DC85|nr:hypothetical protein [Ktedonobacter sp. SOSP1-85]GHO81336.1 hypothetical protein KSD_91070 [Ktedonobacter sp. SOSP1-85]
MFGRTFWTERRFTGITLILGCILFLTAAGLSPTDEKGTYMYDLPLREALMAVFHRWSSWQWGLLLFCIAVVVTLLGFARLTSILREAGNRTFSSSGLIALALATGFILMDMTFRRSIEYWAAQETVKTHVIPALYLQLSLWDTAIFQVYTALTFFAAFMYGMAIVSTRILPHWLGWVIMVYTLAGGALFAFLGDMPPFVHYLLPIVIGVLLLLRRYQVPIRERSREKLIVTPPKLGNEGTLSW